MKFPFFSIVIPTRARPILLRDALISALRQDFEDFEVVASDNFNDNRTQAVLEEFSGEEKLRCIRTDRLLNMPDHWDFATRHARGEYVLILTDRSVLKQGALKIIYNAISSCPESVELCAWPWSLYEDNIGREYGKGRLDGEAIIHFSSRKLVQEFANGLGKYVYCLPRGLNSCYNRTLMERIRSWIVTPFKPISPDYYSAFAFLAIAPAVLFVNQALFISQGEKESNGIGSMLGVDTGYLKTLGTYDFYTQVPIKSLLVKNLIFEDFLLAQKDIGGNLEGVSCDWAAYFENCYRELLIKKEAAKLSSEVMDEFFDEWEKALSDFDPSIQSATMVRVGKLRKIFQMPGFQTPSADNNKKSIIEVAGF